MTGGTALILGPTGRNVAAGMSGGVAYLFDPELLLERRLNTEFVEIEPLDDVDIALVTSLLERHVELTASPLATRLLADLALTIAGIERSALTTETVIVQLLSLVFLCALLAFFCQLRDRRERDLARVRTVSEAAQRVVLHPLPERAGPVSLASAYHAADPDTHLGGDFYAVARTAHSTRVIIGDVRGKGLASIGQTAAMLESFRAAARQELPLPEMVSYLDGSALRGVGEFSRREADQDERFVTLAVAEIPDDEPLVEPEPGPPSEPEEA